MQEVEELGNVANKDRVKELKEVILKEIRNVGDMTFARYVNLAPEEKGDLQWLYPEGENIIMWHKMSKESITAFCELADEKLIQADPCPPLYYMMDGIIPDMPIAKKPIAYKKNRWAPMIWVRGAKWEKK